MRLPLRTAVSVRVGGYPGRRKPQRRMRILRKIIQVVSGIYYSFPLQLIFEQLRNHKTILLFWIFLYLVITNNILSDFGSQYLLLEPELHHEVDYASMFMMGLAMGIFTLTYQMTMYIQDGYKFFFIAMERRPFVKFSLNNAIIPLGFWGLYLYQFWQLNLKEPNPELWETFYQSLTLVGAAVLISTLSVLYFFSLNKDLVRTMGQRVLGELRNKRVILREARRKMGLSHRVDYFFATPFKIKRVPSEMQADFLPIVKMMNRHHANALVAEAILLVLLFLTWLFQDSPALEIPAGAGFLLLFSFVIMLVGAITFWFRRIGFLAVLIFLGVLVFLNQYKPFIGTYYAYGMDYERAEPAPYNLSALDSLASRRHIVRDSLEGTQQLLNWKLRYMKQVEREKPYFVVAMVSGGGNRSALWTMNCLQAIDSVTQGRFRHQLELVTGASGGMIGAAYYRELMRKLPDSSQAFYSADFRERVSRDLINPILFNLVVNSIFPNPRWELDGQTYVKERGYAFEQQLVDNLGVFQDTRLKDYQREVGYGKIPQMIFSPAIVNDGRMLFISSMGVSYLSRSQWFDGPFSTGPTGVDFRDLFRLQNADSLRFSTAIRMNASFPGLLPFVELPSQPSIEAADAGLIDNFGVYTAIRYLFNFRRWIRENTKGVVLIQIRDTRRNRVPAKNKSATLLSRSLGFIGRSYFSMSASKDLLDDHLIDYAPVWLDAPFHVVDLQYVPDSTYRHAALNFHLTEREKVNIRRALWNSTNQRSLKLLQRLLGPAENRPDSLSNQ